jgi:hypothetical protein
MGSQASNSTEQPAGRLGACLSRDTGGCRGGGARLQGPFGRTWGCQSPQVRVHTHHLPACQWACIQGARGQLKSSGGLSMCSIRVSTCGNATCIYGDRLLTRCPLLSKRNKGLGSTCSRGWASRGGRRRTAGIREALDSPGPAACPCLACVHTASPARMREEASCERAHCACHGGAESPSRTCGTDRSRAGCTPAMLAHLLTG